jgi:hypothetical protein
MINNAQLKVVMAAAALPIEKRAQFLESITAMLRLRGRSHFGDADVAEVTQLASAGLIQQPAA